MYANITVSGKKHVLIYEDVLNIRGEVVMWSACIYICTYIQILPVYINVHQSMAEISSGSESRAFSNPSKPLAKSVASTLTGKTSSTSCEPVRVSMHDTISSCDNGSPYSVRAFTKSSLLSLQQMQCNLCASLVTHTVSSDNMYHRLSTRLAHVAAVVAVPHRGAEEMHHVS